MNIFCYSNLLSFFFAGAISQTKIEITETKIHFRKQPNSCVFLEVAQDKWALLNFSL